MKKRAPVPRLLRCWAYVIGLEKMHLQESTLFDLYLGVKVTQNVVQYPPHHMTYAPAKFEVATPDSLEDVFTRKYII